MQTDFQNSMIFQGSEESADLRQGPPQGDWAGRARTGWRSRWRRVQEALNDKPAPFDRSGESRWGLFAYLFAKKDRANIDDDKLLAFRKLAEL